MLVQAGRGLPDPPVTPDAAAPQDGQHRSDAADAGRLGGSVGELTKRQTQVLVLVALGLSDNEIADKLGLTPGTVHRYVAGIRDRLNARNRAHAAVLGIHHGHLIIDGETLRAA